MKQIESSSLTDIIYNLQNWKCVHKKLYSVYMTRPLFGTECYNAHEDCHYVTDQNKQFILSGLSGEFWVINEVQLSNTYTFADGMPITTASLKKISLPTGEIPWHKIVTNCGKVTNYAFHLSLNYINYPIKTLLGDILIANREGIEHGSGDFLVCSALVDGKPNLKDMWVVNGVHFLDKYSIKDSSHAVCEESFLEPVFPSKKFVKFKI